jgi:SPP1 gp7 family putative phage head morphogenesis protein
MNTEAEEVIIRTLTNMQKSIIAALEKAAGRAAARGYAQALAQMRIMPTASQISTPATLYAKQYGAMLTEQGGSMIKGEFVPWLKDSNESERQSIYDIIQRGIDEGRPTGYNERKKGGYPDGTIAHDLEQYFNQRRSHASTVAITEVGRIQNQSTLDSFRDHGVGRVKILDGGGPNSCARCDELNGQVVTVEWASENELEHPHCVRAYEAVFD